MEFEASRLPGFAQSAAPISSDPAGAAPRSLVGAMRRALRAVARALAATPEVQIHVRHSRVKTYSRFPQFWDL